VVSNLFEYLMKETNSPLNLEDARQESKEVQLLAGSFVQKQYNEFLKEAEEVLYKTQKFRKRIWQEKGKLITNEAIEEALTKLADAFGKNFSTYIKKRADGEGVHPDYLITANGYREAQTMLDEIKNPNGKKIWKKFLAWLYLKHLRSQIK